MSLTEQADQMNVEYYEGSCCTNQNKLTNTTIL